MAIDLNDEIIQDFLVEAGEILEKLANQLVDLEQRPFDRDLLNTVFRSFHTIKGGAGFLGLENLVELSHKAEDIFDLLRKGERFVDASLMDVFLQVLDALNQMFDEIRANAEPSAAPRLLLTALQSHASEEVVVFEEPSAASEGTEAEKQNQAKAAETPAFSSVASPSETNHRVLLDALKGQPASAASSDEIADAEFEALLDELHGPGRHGGVPAQEIEFVFPEASLQSADQSAGMKARPAAVSEPASAPDCAPTKATASNMPQTETTVRVETSVLDRIMNMVGELVLIRNRISSLDSAIGNESLSQAAGQLDVVTTDLQAAVMKTRMQPIKKVFGRFPRVVRDLARSLSKEVNLELYGEGTDLDKNLVEALADPLIHLVRNAVDHGIEEPAIRKAKGKPMAGTVRLTAAQEGDHILLTIADDGGGMDPEVLRRKAVEKGLMDEAAAARLDDRGCYELIFSPGFSTKAEISDVSGRGVGMDVVKTRIGQLNGSIEIDSALGKGTTLNIKLPLTLAIMPTLMVMLSKQIFALPLVNVNEILDFDTRNSNVVDGQEVLVVRGRPLPLFFLGQWLTRGLREGQTRRGHVIIVTIGAQRVGLHVDQLVGQEEVVIKPLGALVQGTKGLAGATITGDGRIALILDLPSLITAYAHRR